MATTLPSTTIDPSKPGKYRIHVSDDLLRDAPARKRQRISLQYNHKPPSLSDQTGLLRNIQDGTQDEYEMTVDEVEGTGKYIYKGNQRPHASSAMALVYNPEQGCFILERIDADLYLNLSSTPTEKNSKNLAAKHPQLGANGVEDAEGAAAEAEEEVDPDTIPPDPDNPYDYRHHLKQGVNPSPQRSLNSSPVPNHTFYSSPLVQAMSSNDRPRKSIETQEPRSKPKPKPKPNPKQAQPRNQFLSPKPREEESESNELIIDMGEDAPANPKPWRKQLGVLNDGRREGPISLRSAASSMSPSVQPESEDEKDKSDDDVEEIDLGQSRLEGSSGDEAEPEKSGDKDNGWDDEDEDIFAAELEQAMVEEAEKGQAEEQSQAPPVQAAESSSESEAD